MHCSMRLFFPLGYCSARSLMKMRMDAVIYALITELLPLQTYLTKKKGCLAFETASFK